jgi:hypothetical protein
MFTIDQAISEWRRQMLAAGIKTPVPLEELEIHLREEIERQMTSGTDPQQAFENSVQQMGHADELKGEFKKLGGSESLLSPWSLFWTGVLGLVMNPILSWITRFVSHGSGLDSLSHPSWAVWLPNYVTFTTFTISGLAIGFARWHTKWTLLWISSLGLVGTTMANFTRLSAFLQRADFPWWGLYFNWTIFIIMGLLLGLSNYTLWLNKLIPHPKIARD